MSFEGLYGEHHGVSGNGAYDPIQKKFIPYGHELIHVSEQIVPIWRLNESKGGKSGIYMWVGGEFAYQGKKPTVFKPLDKNIKMKQRVNDVISWLKQGVNLAMLYLGEPDKTEHAYGPNSKQVRNIIDFYLSFHCIHVV